MEIKNETFEHRIEMSEKTIKLTKEDFTKLQKKNDFFIEQTESDFIQYQTIQISAMNMIQDSVMDTLRIANESLEHQVSEQMSKLRIELARINDSYIEVLDKFG